MFSVPVAVIVVDGAESVILFVLTVANIRHLLVMLLSTTVDSGKTEYTICRYIRRSSCSRLTIGMIRSPIFVSIHGRSGSQRPAAKTILSETPHIVLQQKKGRLFFFLHIMRN